MHKAGYTLDRMSIAGLTLTHAPIHTQFTDYVLVILLKSSNAAPQRNFNTMYKPCSTLSHSL